MKNVGLYFGSFNPIHTGHLIIAEHFASRTELDEVWLVVSPQNPFKANADLAPEQHRLEMVKLAIKDSRKLQACEVEFEMDKPSYTVNTLRVLSNNFPKYSFTLLMGEDNIASFDKWKEYEYILENYSIRIFPRLDRTGNTEIKLIGRDVQKINAPVIEISSTYIRESIQANKSIRYLTTDIVRKYIRKYGLFQ